MKVYQKSQVVISLVFILVISSLAVIQANSTSNTDEIIIEVCKNGIVYIPPGTGFTTIKQSLIKQQIIGDDIRFDLLARWMGTAGKMKAGEYLFPADLSHREIIKKLTDGEILYRPLTIPEGANIRQVADALATHFSFDRQIFLQRVQDQEFISSLGLTIPSLEGYLFPDTYFITRGQSLERVISMMVKRFQQIFEDVSSHYPAVATPLSPHEVVILASIVEKETALAAERPLIAAVFLNRLKKNMKLQADPTVIYGIADFNGNLTRQDLRTPSPYNTYTQKGLPAGPIANPGREALLAVLQPADVNYLYFVAKKDVPLPHF